MLSKFKVIFKGSSSVKRKKIYHNVRVEDPDEVWTIKGEIGDGAYGKVYRAEHIINGTQAALKKVTLEEEDDLDNFMVEIDILAECQHPNIVGLLEAYHWDGCLWMYLEYCDGGAVDSIMVDLDRPLTEPQIAYISYHLLRALDYIHQHKVIHRDLKAGNVLLTTDGGVKLADFGVSAKNKNTLDKRGTFIGTPYWLAPEVIKCETFIDSKYDYKADIWSLGITLIEFAQMDPPNHEVSPLRVLLKIQKSDPPKLDCPSKFSKEFNAFIAACLVKEPEERPDARDLLLHPFVNGSQNAKHIVALLIEYQADVVEEDVDDDNASRMSLESEDHGSSSAEVSVASSDSTAARHLKEVTPTGVTERRQSKGPAPPPPGLQRKGPAPSVPSPVTTPVTTPTSVPLSASSAPVAASVHTSTELSTLLSSTSVTAITSLSSDTLTATSVTTPTSVAIVPSKKELLKVVDDSHAPFPRVMTSGPSASPVSITSVGTSMSQSAMPVMTPSQIVASTPVTSTPIKDSNSGKEDGEEFNKSHPVVTSTTTVTIASDGVVDDSAYVTVPASPADTLVNVVVHSGVSVSGDATVSSVVSSVVSVSNSDYLAFSDAPASLAVSALSPTSFVTSSQDVSMVSITTLGDSKDNFGNDSTLVICEKQEVREDPAVSGEINQPVVVESTSITQIVAGALNDLQDSHVVASSTVVSVEDSCHADFPAIVSATNSASALPAMTSPTIVLTDHHSLSEADISSPQSISPTPDEDIILSIASGRRSAEERQRSPDSPQEYTPDIVLPGVLVDDSISSPLRGATTSISDSVDASADAVRPGSSPLSAQIIASIGSEGTVIVRTPTPTSSSPTAQLDAAQQLANQSVITFSGPGVVDRISPGQDLDTDVSSDQSPRYISAQLDVGQASHPCHGVLDFTSAEEEAVQLLDDVIDHHADNAKDSLTSLEYSATVNTVISPATDAPAVCLATEPTGGSQVVVLDAVKETDDEVVVVVAAAAAGLKDQVVISNSSILEGESNTDDVPAVSSLAPVQPSQVVSPHISVVSVPKGANAGNTCLTIEGTTLGDTDVDSIVLATREEDTVDRSSPSQLRPAVLTNGRENAVITGPGRKAVVEDRSDSDSVSTVSSEKENSKPRHGGSTSGEDDVVQLRRQAGRTVSAKTSSVSLAISGTGPGSRSAHSLSMNSEVLHEDTSLLRPVDRNRQNRQTNLMRNGRTKEENDSLALRKKTRKRTRKFMIDGVVVTTTTSKVIYGDDEDCILIPSGHHARKLELRELKILQKQEQKQFQELGIKASVARQEQERKFDMERTQLVRTYDNDVDLLNRHQKQQVERTEAQHELELKGSSKKIRTDQEKELRLFRDSLKTELKLLKQEVDLLPKDVRKEALRGRKERLEADQAEREKAFLERLHQNHESSMKRLSEEHRSHVALLERHFLQKKHQLLRAREAALWELEERHLHDRHQLAKRQLKDIFFLQRHQMLLRHEKELEQVRRQNTQREEDLVKRQQVERRSMPKRIRQEMKARELMFRESMRISTSNLPDSHHDEKERLRKFQECEKRRYEAEKRRHEQKHKRQLEELQATTEAHAKELEQMQNEKRKMLMEHETIKLKAQDEDYHKELREWKNNLKPRKQKLEDEFEQQLQEQEQFYGAYLTATSGGLLNAAGPEIAQ